MNEPTESPSPEEAVLAAFVADLEAAAEPQAILADYCARHPALADRLCEHTHFMRTLDQLGPGDGQCPARLGDFRIVRRLRVGGMGEVYEAVQEPLDRRVAVKVIRRDRFSPELRARFLREQQVLASLHQTHIVPIHAAGMEGPLQFFAMPFIQGASLFHIIEYLRPGPACVSASTPSLAQLVGLLSTQTADDTSANHDAPARPTTSATPQAPARRRFSAAYYRSAAQFMIDAAEALAHAHQLGILHRDVKPSNLMVDDAGHCWIIDFGLATYLNGSKANGAGRPAAQTEAEPLTRQGLAGTPEYMAPEQWRGEAVDARTDVWGLGATLYELLTLRRAFAAETVDGVRQRVLDTEPAAAEQQVRGLPRDLAAIVRKALAKEPARRYGSAAEFAADLRHWLTGEPTVARPAWVPRRVWLWARRHKGWAVLLAALFLAGAGLAAAGWVQEREQRREMLMAQLQLRRFQKQYGGWSTDAWEEVRAVARMRADARVRDQAAVTLIGLDATETKFIERDAVSVVFDASGKRLLIGGADDRRDGQPREAARLWQVDTQTETIAAKAGAGPVAFGADGAPLHVVVSAADPRTLELWDVALGKRVRAFRMPGDGPLMNLKMALAPGAGLLAVTAPLAGGKKKCMLALWDVPSGKALRRDVIAEEEITGLAVDAACGYVAVGSETGSAALYPVAGGPPESLPTTGTAPVNCFDFHNAAGPRAADGAAPWLLAVGEDGGRVTVWDLRHRQPLTRCYGSDWDVYTVRFSPDGMTLASAGRYLIRLWDIATGRQLLALAQESCIDLSFSPDGNHLAAAAVSVYGREGATRVWQLDPDRGIQTYRGLAAPVAHVALSAKARYLAAMADDWQVTVWDRLAGRRLHLWNGPRSATADHAALTFSRDETLLAVSAGREARVWELATGKVWKSWVLPPGLHDLLAFDESGKKLFSLREETAGAVRAPYEKRDARADPLVARFRDLLLDADAKKAILHTIGGFKEVTRSASGTAGGPFVVTLVTQGPLGSEHHIKVFDPANGRELWSGQNGGFAIDPLGRVLLHTGEHRLLALPTGKTIAHCVIPANIPNNVLSAEGAFVAGRADQYRLGSSGQAVGISLTRRSDGAIVVVLGIDSTVSGQPIGTFSEDSRFLAWGNQDGTVHVANLPQVQRRLAGIRLGW